MLSISRPTDADRRTESGIFQPQSENPQPQFSSSLQLITQERLTPLLGGPMR